LTERKKNSTKRRKWTYASTRSREQEKGGCPKEPGQPLTVRCGFLPFRHRTTRKLTENISVWFSAFLWQTALTHSQWIATGATPWDDAGYAGADHIQSRTPTYPCGRLYNQTHSIVSPKPSGTPGGFSTRVRLTYPALYNRMKKSANTRQKALP
jgi:hypothetical protein